VLPIPKRLAKQAGNGRLLIPDGKSDIRKRREQQIKCIVSSIQRKRENGEEDGIEHIERKLVPLRRCGRKNTETTVANMIRRGGESIRNIGS
jgi:hypothetical protein